MSLQGSTDQHHISLAYLPPTPRQGWSALAGAAVLLLGLAVLAPFAAYPLPQGKYPPAEPGALGSEPLKAAISGHPASLTTGAILSYCLEQTIPIPKRRSFCGASRDIAAIDATS